MLEACWTQWIAQRQWEQARRDLDGIALVGDLPFMVSADSADVWARQSLFSREASVGTPPDAFSETGQDWGLPVYLWDAMRADDFGWLRARGRRMAEMFDGFRIDHLVGFYRTYWRPANGDAPFFVPADEAGPARTRRGGHRGVRQCRRGTDCRGPRHHSRLRAGLAASRCSCPATRCCAGSGDWHVDGPAVPRSGDVRRRRRWRRPARTTRTCSPTGGTTSTLEERTALLAMPGLREAGVTARRSRTTTALRDALIDVLMQSGSDLVIFPLQDVFGWRDRINVPATVGPTNWSWATPIPVDRLMDDPIARERADDPPTRRRSAPSARRHGA